MNSKIENLNPEVAEKAKLLIEKCKDQDIDIVITSTLRTKDEQEALYAQGRSSLFNVNELRKKAGMSPIREYDNMNKVSWTLKSKHLSGNAFDIAVKVNGKITYNRIDLYKQVAKIGESIGLKPGANFKTPDYPHFEI
jgi:peptidoglycan L-alanyl-D-glutamate endopeptidase CwlK